MREQMPVYKKEKETKLGLEQHNSFFSGKFEKIAANSLLGVGSVFALAGIYEFVTGQKVGDLVSVYANQLPDLANYLINHLDQMPFIFKTGVGSSMISLGQLLDKK